MKLGVVSDTHNQLANVRRIVELFNAAGVERVVHTGDITQAKTLEVFARLDAPLEGVFGNNDQERDALEAAARSYGFRFADPPLCLELASRRVVVVHDPLEFEQTDVAFEVGLHGHTHRHRCEHRAGNLFFNPGECAGHLAGHNAVGILDLTSLETELLKF